MFEIVFYGAEDEVIQRTTLPSELNTLELAQTNATPFVNSYMQSPVGSLVSRWEVQEKKYERKI